MQARGVGGVHGVVAGTILGAILLALAVVARAAAGVQSANPWWFEDGYTSHAFVDAAASTADVRTAGAGTVSLPLRPAGLSFDPGAAVGLIATAGGIRAWAFDGAAMVPAPQFDLGGTGYRGAAWIGPEGRQLAAATADAVTLAAWSGSSWVEVATLALSGATSVAEGARPAGSAAGILVGTPTGFDVLEYEGGALVVDPGAGVSDLHGAGGVTSAPGGALVAVWHGEGVSVYGWDGSAYREAPTWEIPAGSQPIRAVAWFRGGNGYWVLAADGLLSAYGFDGSFLRRVPALSTTLALPVAALATGWRQGDVAVLESSGWRYEDGSPLAPDAARSVMGLALALYAPSARLQSTAIAVGHNLAEIQVDATIADLPPGSAVAYEVSTDGGSNWTKTAPCINPSDPLRQCAVDNTAVAPGHEVVYRLTLTTSDPAVTPVVDATDLFEIATEVESTSGARAILIR